jgi:hypothetical protein
VFAYDTAGSGDGVARSNDRSGGQIVGEPHGLLAQLDNGPRCALVAHSMDP